MSTQQPPKKRTSLIHTTKAKVTSITVPSKDSGSTSPRSKSAENTPRVSKTHSNDVPDDASMAETTPVEAEPSFVELYLPDTGCGIIHSWFLQVGDSVFEGSKMGEAETNTDLLVPIVAPSDGIIQSLHPIGKNITDRIAVAVIKLEAQDREDQNSFDTQPIIERLDQLLKKRKEMQQRHDNATTETEIGFLNDVLSEIDTRVCEKRKELLNIYKKLMKSKKEKFVQTRFPIFTLEPDYAAKLVSFVPYLQLDPNILEKPKQMVTFVTLITQKEKHHALSNVFFGRSTSTYPHLPKKATREGEPICDQYRVLLTPNFSILTLADGCNWGPAPALAAFKGCKGFVDFIMKNRHKIGNTQRLAQLTLKGIEHAHNVIISEDIEDGKNVGTTTLLGGMLVQVMLPETDSASPPPIAQNRDWLFIFASIGDCKAFLYQKATKRVEELTPDSRNENASDASDCGGRIGPYIDDGPDLRNLDVFMSPCLDGDIIFICSDGVHDNFDPQQHGMTPKEFDLDCETWSSGDPSIVNQVKSEYRCKKMLEIIDNDDDPTPEIITERLIQYSEKVNIPSQEFMCEFPGKRLPHDYSRFPGKMDHTTMIALRVGEINLSTLRSKRKQMSDTEAIVKRRISPYKKTGEAESEQELGGQKDEDTDDSKSDPMILSAEITAQIDTSPNVSKLTRQLCKEAAVRMKSLTGAAMDSIEDKKITSEAFAQLMKSAITHSTALSEYAKKNNLIQEAEELKTSTTKCIAYAKIVFDNMSCGPDEQKREKINLYQSMVAVAIHEIVTKLSTV